jgi:hypothetical protein
MMVAIGTGVYAQKDGVAPLAKGQHQLNFGLGFNNYGLPVYVSFDFAVHKDVTVTPQVNLVIDDEIRFGALVKADYHWNYLIGIPSEWDFYSGARIGFISGDNFDMDFGIQVGGRWYWSEKWALNLEFAGGSGFGTVLGVSLKL